jgi:FkbM family methyltransferase
MTRTRHASGLLYRPEYEEQNLIVEMPRAYGKLGIVPGDVVLDVGGNIGAFAHWALAQGANRVVSVEPARENLQLLRANAKGRPVEVVAAAVVGDAHEGRTATLYLNGGTNRASHSLHVQRGRTPVRTPVVRWRELLASEPFTVVKVDCEGSEYEYDFTALPATVRALAVELHLNKKHWRATAAPALLRQVEQAGFRLVKPPTITDVNWHTVPVWHRPTENA